MRLVLIILVALLALWLPRPPSAVGQYRDAGGEPEITDQSVLPASPGRYGSIQHRRTPLPPRSIALTFDDGPSANLPRVLDILEARGIHATFFFVGQWVQARPDLVREAARRGHNVGCHSWSHPTTLRRWNAPAQIAQVRRCFAVLEAALADEAPDVRARLEPMFRFPGLNEGPWLLDWLDQRGVMTLSAEAGTDDWRGISAASITRRTIANMESTDGGVLILHETRPNMVSALPGLLDDLHDRGFTFVQITAGEDGRERALAVDDPVLIQR